MKNFNLYLLLAVIGFGCSKSKIDNTYEWVSIDENIQLESIDFTDNQKGYVCGGNRDENGFVYKTMDAGKTWSKIHETNYNHCLYAITFINDSTGYIGGDYTYFCKTTDAGQTWYQYWFKPKELSYHEKNRPDIKKILFLNNSIGYFVGGENYSKGAIYRTFDAGNSWKFDTLNNEMRDIAFDNSGNGFAAGYGFLGKTSDGNQFIQEKLDGDFFIGIEHLQNNTFVLVTNNGAIYTYDNDWKQVKHGNKLFQNRLSFTDVCSSKNYVYAVGSNGLIATSDDYGQTWDFFQIDKDVHFTNATLTSEFLFATTTNGKVLRMNI